MKKPLCSLALALCMVFSLPAALAVDPGPDLAHAADQSITVDGRSVAFQTYALLDDNGYSTNYVKLRDIAHILNGTGAQFSVDYSPEAGISVTTGTAYQDIGTEMSTPFAGADKTYLRQNLTLPINGVSVSLDAITLRDDNGGGYNYFKLRDLGKALNFFVDWDDSAGAVILDTSRGAEPDNSLSAMAAAMLEVLDRETSSWGSACLIDADGDGVKELIVLGIETARLYDWNNGQLSARNVGILAGGQFDWWLCLDTATGALGIEFQVTGGYYDNSTFYYPSREIHLGHSFNYDDGLDDNSYRVEDREVSQAEYAAVRGQNPRLEHIIGDEDLYTPDRLGETRAELELLLAGKTARDISDEALLRIAQQLEWEVSSMSISIMNGWPTVCDYNDSIPVDTDGGGVTDYYRVIGFTSVDDVIRTTQELWYRKVSRPGPAAELVFASDIRERYITSGGALYRHDLGMGDGGIVGIIDHMVSRTGDRAVFSGHSTYDGEDNLGDFQITLVYEDGTWKYCSMPSE